MFINHYSSSSFQYSLDYIPLASTVKSSFDISKRIQASRQAPANQIIQKKYSYQHLHDRPLLRSVILLIPFIGNFLIALYDFSALCLSNHYLKKGKNLENGSELQQQQALIFFQKAVDLRNGAASRHLAKFLFERSIVNFEQLYIICIKAAESGDPSYLYQLGKRFSDEKSGEKDEEKAFNCFLQSAQFGFKESYYIVSMRFEEGNGVDKCPKSSLYWLQKAAQEGDGFACYRLGLLYEQGERVAKSEKLAMEWFLKAAAAENIDAFKRLASTYFEGKGVEKDEAKGIYYYNKAFEAGNTEILIELANKLIEKFPIGISQTDEAYPFHTMRLDMAIEFLKASARRGSGLAARRLVEIYQNERPNWRAKEVWDEKGAELEDAECLYQFGMKKLRHSLDGFHSYKMLADGKLEEIIDPEKVKGLELGPRMFEKAASKGHKKSHYQLGLLFLEYLPIKDEVKGLEWLHKGAAINCGDCLKKLGDYYAAQTPPDLEKAKVFYHRACDIIPDTYLSLCMIFLQENPCDFQKILEHLKIGAQQKSVKCLRTLGNIYLGRQLSAQSLQVDEKFLKEAKVTLDRAKAIEYFEKALILAESSLEAHNLAELCEEDNDGERAVKYYEIASQVPEQQIFSATFEAGRIYEEGKIIKKDLRKAFEFYIRDTSQDLRCNIQLAKMYERGIPGFLSPDLNQAFYHYHQACGCDPEAMLKVAQMYESGKGVCRNLTKALKWYKRAAENEEREAIDWLYRNNLQEV